MFQGHPPNPGANTNCYLSGHFGQPPLYRTFNSEHQSSICGHAPHISEGAQRPMCLFKVTCFPSNIDNDFRVLSLSYLRFLKPQLLNEVRFGYTNTLGSTSAQAPFQWSDLGVSAGAMNNENGLPSLAIVGSINLASGFPRTFDQHRFYFSDILTFSSTHHLIQAGGSLSRIRNDLTIVGLGSLGEFLSWPDFLLGLDAQQNGTNLFSNVYASIDDYGLLNREYRSWNGSLYVGDHYRATNTLTLDAGLRYERIGQFGD